MTYILGLSGGIGSGKTAVSDRFAQLGIEIVDADIVSREVVEPGTDALAKITEKFGADIIDNNGELDRAELRRIIFSEPDKKKWLEELLHPLIGMEIFKQLEEAQSPYVIFVSPLMIESGQDLMCDELVVVDVPEEIQLERTMTRDDNDAAQVKAIMSSQASRQQRLDKASQVIENWHGFEQLDLRVSELHQYYIKQAQQKAENHE